MTLLHGKKTVVETYTQLFNRTKIDEIELLRAADRNVVAAVNNVRAENGVELAESIGDFRRVEIEHELNEIDKLSALISALENHDSVWVHTYDGITHTLIEITGNSPDPRRASSVDTNTAEELPGQTHQ